MERKKAVMTVSLISESAEKKTSKITQELLDWLWGDTVSIPWVKDAEDMTVKDE
jgi:hypothetical protein